MREQQGVDTVLPLAALEQRIPELTKGRKVHTHATSDHRTTARIGKLLGAPLDFYDDDSFGSTELITTLGKLRAAKQPEEIEAMRRTAAITDEAHRAAMSLTRPGVTEERLAGAVTGTFARHGCIPAYNTILSVRGEVLHNNAHTNTCKDGDIVLLDAGAEGKSGYCSDVTRCWPVGGKFTPEAAEIYDCVLAAEMASIEMVRPGVRYRDLHLRSAQVIAERLVGMDILRGNPDSLVEKGAHALFFPHGVGHLIGLDVHDMEGYGDRVHYAAGRSRSDQFGTAYLRLDVDLTEGMTFTIEPGVYFVPAILQDATFREQFQNDVNWDRCEQFLRMNEGRGFGGIRIEDDVLTTSDSFEVLTAAVPKQRGEVEALVGTAAN